ncbi:MAG: hypothetical protein RL757_2962 [Bacteroidota bacterium]|jgi:uncharacterized protein (DUF1501 family)
MERRNFLKKAAWGAVMPNLINGHHVSAVGLSPWLESLTNTAVETDHVLVIIQMSGGNDGLNMVIPLDQYTNLAAARGNVLINDTQVLRLNGVTNTGLHPAMTGMRDLFNEGKLRIIQSVGYPTPNFSHFRATDIWLSASNSTEQLYSGWVGRYLNTEYANYPAGYPNTVMPDPLAIQVSTSLAALMQGPVVGMGVTIPNDPSNPYLIDPTYPDPAPSGNAGKELAYIRTVARQTRSYNDIVKSAYAAGGPPAANVPYPAAAARNGLAEQLKTVARLIKGGLKTRVYIVNTGGFDTHSGQVDTNDHAIGTHANLLKTVSDAVFAFQRDTESRGISGRVLGMTFSEFGRRIKSNASLGTDHGAAAPLFVFGERLFGGVLGSSPTINATTGVNDNIIMQYDFRSIYASILKDWFCVPDQTIDSAIMLRNFQRLRIVNSPNCITPTHEINQKAGLTLVSAYPNPFDWATTIEFESFGGFAMVQIFDVSGRVIATPAKGEFAPGKYKVRFEAPNLAAGVYYVRYENEDLQQVKPLVKVQ